MVVGPQLLIYGNHRIYGFTFKPILKLLITYFTIWFRYLFFPRPTQRLASDQWLILELIIAMVYTRALPSVGTQSNMTADVCTTLDTEAGEGGWRWRCCSS